LDCNLQSLDLWLIYYGTTWSSMVGSELNND